MCIREQRYSIEKKAKIVYTKQIMNNLMLSVDGIPSENGIFQEVSQEVKNLQEDIKTGKFKNAYLLFGEEAYLKIQYKEKLIHALNPDDDTMNFTKYEGKGIEVREMIDLCETMPFFADHRVVLVENSGFFKNKCDELADYMKTLPDYEIKLPV